MVVNVLLVDDSAVVRGLIGRALGADPRIRIMGTASNGQAAIDIARSMQPDIVILDIEMPVMDGLTALPQILKVSPNSKVIIASSLSQHNAAPTIKAMTLGAADCIGKPSGASGSTVDAFYDELLRKVKAIAGIAEDNPVPVNMVPVNRSPHAPSKGVKALAIASSTGGPQALMKLFEDIRGGFSHLPIFITQHMPANFTQMLAEHLARAGNRTCAEGVQGEVVTAGRVYIAPGDYHMLVEPGASGVPVIRLTQDPPENFCRPSADPMLRSLSRIYGAQLLTLVLTGMGQDAMEGCRHAVSAGGTVIAQDAATSVVYGMPKAVAEQGLCHHVLPLQDIGAYLLNHINAV